MDALEDLRIEESRDVELRCEIGPGVTIKRAEAFVAYTEETYSEQFAQGLPITTHIRVPLTRETGTPTRSNRPRIAGEAAC